MGVDRAIALMMEAAITSEASVNFLPHYTAQQPRRQPSSPHYKIKKKRLQAGKM
jgi:hypothetical protein